MTESSNNLNFIGLNFNGGFISDCQNCLYFLDYKVKYVKLLKVAEDIEDKLQRWFQS